MEEQYKYDLFDRYFRGELSQEELDDFLERLKSDEEFKKELEMYQLLVEGIREHERQELKAFLVDKARVRFMGNPWSKAWTYASAAIIAGFGILYLVMDNSIQQEPTAESSKPAQIQTPVDTTQPGNTKEEVTNNQSLTKKMPIPDPEVEIKEETPAEEVADVLNIEDTTELQSGETDAELPGYEKPHRMASMEKKQDFPVKEDTHLFDTTFTLQIKFQPDSVQNIQKPKGPVSERIEVQFWKSPINYKGYRFDGRKLQVFGLDTFSQVSLRYHVLDASLGVYQVYLKYGENYFKLNDNYRYNAYMREEDTSIIQNLK
ncbi:MAG: hypothetical protein GC180_01880 [Bacteroidetes bacterium]|nr:hypothetical protein [Bacteroidota bacterium]